MITATLRRLDDRERYWGLTWPGWVALIAGLGGLYLAVRLSPLGVRPTITITLFVIAFAAMVLSGISGQALSPGRQLLAIISYRRSRKLLTLSDRVDRRGLVLDRVPVGVSAGPTTASAESDPRPVDVDQHDDDEAEPVRSELVDGQSAQVDVARRDQTDSQNAGREHRGVDADEQTDEDLRRRVDELHFSAGREPISGRGAAGAEHQSDGEEHR